MSYYFTVLALSVFVPLIFSFHRRIKFHVHFNNALKAIAISSVPFLIWDMLFTEMGVWGFNSKFISGLNIVNLPAEEVLFFLVIPFCCLFTFHLIEKFNISFFNFKSWRLFHLLASITLLCIAIINYHRLYTAVCLVLCIAVIYIASRSGSDIDFNFFYTNFALNIVTFIIVNGALTGMFYGQTVVWYNPSEILGIRIITIPIEDLFYCHQLLLFNLYAYKRLAASGE